MQQKLYTPVYDQFSLFPFYPAAPDSESFYRLQHTNTNDECLLDITFFPDPWNPGFGFNVKYLLKKDVGILSSQAFQFKGFPSSFIRTRYYFHSVTEVGVIVEKPKDFLLSQNYPNPFNPSTKISWQTPVSSWQTLKVYDVLGNEVATLVNEYRPAGNYGIEFYASHLPSGVYFYQLRTGDPSTSSVQSFVETKKMILLK